MKDTVRIGYIGLGRRGMAVLKHNVAKMADVEIVALCDTYAPCLDEAAQMLEGMGVPAPRLTADYRDIVNDPTIDAVVITSETNRHQELTTLMANAGKHLFVEKPLGFAAADAKELAQLIRSKGIIFQTGYFLRGLGAIRQIKKLADEGKFGTITRMRFCNCHTNSH